MDEEEKLRLARRQVGYMTGFYIHLTVFVLVMVLLAFINGSTKASWWIHWPFLGWGVFVVAHGVAVFGNLPSLITEWQQRKTKELADKM